VKAEKLGSSRGDPGDPRQADLDQPDYDVAFGCETTTGSLGNFNMLVRGNHFGIESLDRGLPYHPTGVYGCVSGGINWLQFIVAWK
jgi:hypothetical protein